MPRINCIGILTSGGDAPGMNAAIRAITRSAICKNFTVKGIYRGYDGLVNDEIKEFTTESVSNIIAKGGTILKSARSKAFMTPEGRKQAYEVMQQEKIDALVVIGGNGSLTGAKIFADEFNVPCIGLPGTIDNDLYGTDLTIGYDTTLNTIMECVDKIRDTANSHERIFFVEVMGRDAGYLALWCGIANGAERILLPEQHGYDEQAIIDDIIENRNRGKKHYIIINAEGVGDSINMAKRIEEATGVETRATILGHLQRGGSPTVKDRVYASIMGAKAVDLLAEGKSNRVVGYQHGEYIDFDINDALKMNKEISEYQVEVAKLL